MERRLHLVCGRGLGLGGVGWGAVELDYMRVFNLNMGRRLHLVCGRETGSRWGAVVLDYMKVVGLWGKTGIVDW